MANTVTPAVTMQNVGALACVENLTPEVRRGSSIGSGRGNGGKGSSGGLIRFGGYGSSVGLVKQ